MLTGFSDKKVVSLLDTHSLWSKRACREILGRKSDFIPLLVDVLDTAINNPEPFMAEERSSHIPAALLLAQMRAPEAYPRLVNLLSYDDEDITDLWGDMLTEYYPWMLRDTFNGEAFLLPRLIEDRSVSPWARAMAVKAWGMHYFDGYLSREEIIGCFRHLIRDVYTGRLEDDDETVISYIAICIREHQLEELIEDVKTVYARDAIDKGLCGNSNEYVEGFKNPLFAAEDQHIDDTIHELERWEWFKEEKSEEAESDDDGEGDYEKYKIGRNDPCPCDSGKKYKHCCLGK